MHRGDTEGRRPVTRDGLFLLGLLVLVAVGGRLASLHATGIARAQFDGCVANVKNISVAVEMYGNDNGGRYPTRLDLLLHPEPYLKSIPTCPAEARDTYTRSYAGTATPLDHFTLCCDGDHSRAPQAVDGNPRVLHSTFGGNWVVAPPIPEVWI